MFEYKFWQEEDEYKLQIKDTIYTLTKDQVMTLYYYICKELDVPCH